MNCYVNVQLFVVLATLVMKVRFHITDHQRLLWIHLITTKRGNSNRQ